MRLDGRNLLEDDAIQQRKEERLRKLRKERQSAEVRSLIAGGIIYDGLGVNVRAGRWHVIGSLSDFHLFDPVMCYILYFVCRGVAIIWL